MWNLECCRCYRQGPRNEIFGYAYDGALAQGFRNISIMYWLENDPYRPALWEPRQAGPISIHSTLCELCHDITLEKYFNMLKIYALNHDYRFISGSGGHSNMCHRSDGYFDNYTICANCRREFHRGPKYYLYSDLQAGYIIVGIGNGDGSMSFCPNCPRKLTINDLKPLQAQWKIEAEKARQKFLAEIMAASASSKPHDSSS